MKNDKENSDFVESGILWFCFFVLLVIGYIFFELPKQSIIPFIGLLSFFVALGIILDLFSVLFKDKEEIDNFWRKRGVINRRR